MTLKESLNINYKIKINKISDIDFWSYNNKEENKDEINTSLDNILNLFIKI